MDMNIEELRAGRALDWMIENPGRALAPASGGKIAVRRSDGRWEMRFPYGEWSPASEPTHFAGSAEGYLLDALSDPELVWIETE